MNLLVDLFSCKMTNVCFFMLQFMNKYHTWLKYEECVAGVCFMTMPMLHSICCYVLYMLSITSACFLHTIYYCFLSNPIHLFHVSSCPYRPEVLRCAPTWYSISSPMLVEAFEYMHFTHAMLLTARPPHTMMINLDHVNSYHDVFYIIHAPWMLHDLCFLCDKFIHACLIRRSMTVNLLYHVLW